MGLALHLFAALRYSRTATTNRNRYALRYCAPDHIGCRGAFLYRRFVTPPQGFGVGGLPVFGLPWGFVGLQVRRLWGRLGAWGRKFPHPKFTIFTISRYYRHDTPKIKICKA